MIIFLGIAGAGKGTQAHILARHFKSTPLSTGEILRRHRKDAEIQKYLSKGKLVPDKVLLPIIENEIITAGGEHDHVILDGLPRTMSQAKWLVRKIRAGVFELSGIVHFNLSVRVAKERLIKRHRSDDTDEVIAQRFLEYKKSILPIISYFQSEGFDVHHIDAEKSVAEVSKTVKSTLGV